MTTVTVNASKKYDIKIGSGLLATLGMEASALRKAEKVCVVSDDTVYPLFGEAVCQSLSEENFEIYNYIFPAGEESKNGETYLRLLDTLAQHKLTRNDLIIALGGGVVGDLAGFAAATYLRGIRIIQIPTTLLAMVDSSVGGKTAIDLPAGKNLCGAFYQPSLVLCDTDVLKSLPTDIFRDGCAEVIKYSILYDPCLFSELMDAGLNFDRESVIARCVRWKRDVVMEDEFDTGSRMKLNLGHTIGHGVEAKSHFCLSHGKSVAIGMAVVARACAKQNFCHISTSQAVEAILNHFGLPSYTEYSSEDIYSYALSDKKRSGSTVNLILPRCIGNCEVVPTLVSQLKSFIEAGL